MSELMIYWLLQFQTWTQKLKSRGEQGACAPPRFSNTQAMCHLSYNLVFFLKNFKGAK